LNYLNLQLTEAGLKVHGSKLKLAGITNYIIVSQRTISFSAESHFLRGFLTSSGSTPIFYNFINRLTQSPNFSMKTEIFPIRFLILVRLVKPNGHLIIPVKYIHALLQ